MWGYVIRDLVWNGCVVHGFRGVCVWVGFLGLVGFGGFGIALGLAIVGFDLL